MEKNKEKRSDRQSKAYPSKKGSAKNSAKASQVVIHKTNKHNGSHSSANLGVKVN
jgi:hypothetical protein